MNPKLSVICVCFAVMLSAACGGVKVGTRTAGDSKVGVGELQKGSQWYRKGCYERALAHFRIAYRRLALIDHVSGLAACLNNIGNIYKSRGEFDQALQYYKESFELYEQIDHATGGVHALSNQAAVLIRAERLNQADKLLAKAENLAAAKGIALAALLTNRGIYYLKTDAYTEAETVLNRALALGGQGTTEQLAGVHAALGSLMHKTGRLAQALEHYHAALEVDRRSGFSRGIAEDLAAIGQIELARGRQPAAIAALKRSARIYALMKDERALSPILAQLDQLSAITAPYTPRDLEVIENWLNDPVATSPCD